MSQKKIGVMSIALVFAFAAAMIVPSIVFASWNIQSGSGDYTTVQVAVAGNFRNGKLYGPAAYVKAVIDHDLPDNHSLIIYYRFEWTDLNQVSHIQEGVNTTSCTKAGQWIRIDCTGLPSVVYDIYAEGRAGYDGVWDTPLVSASLPWL